MDLRCWNCGILGHKTQTCPRWGPRCPGPGKTSQDYAEEAQRIHDLIAGDLLREHLGHGHDGDEGGAVDQRPARGLGRATREARARAYACPLLMCLASVGDPCRSRKGTATVAHKARYTLSEEGEDDRSVDWEGSVDALEDAAPA